MQVKKQYAKMNKMLKDSEKATIQLRYSLLNGGFKTLREVAKMLDISRPYVLRIEKRSTKK